MDIVEFSRVLVVLADHHQVDVLVPGADPRVALARPQAGVQVQLLAQGHVDAAEPGADGRGQRPLDRHPVAADGVEHLLGQGRAVTVDDLGPGLLDVPVELDAGALQDPAGRLRQLWSDPVAGDERDAMGHGGKLLCSRCRQGYLCTADAGGKPLRLHPDPPPRDDRRHPQMADATGKGLEGVVAAETRISDVDGRQGRLFYAGYDIADLAAHATFEETVYLLHHLELPTAAQLEETVATLRAESTLDPLLVELIASLAERTGPMTTLRTAVSAAAAVDPDDDDSDEANLRKAYRLIARTPQIIATYQRLATGGDAIEPRDDLGVAANFLYALTGKQPDPQVARDFDVVLVLYADHTLNASTFAGRVAAATLQGPLHGGAIQAVREMLEEIGTPDRAPGWIRDHLAAKRKVMGFGHRVYKTWDPRAT